MEANKVLRWCWVSLLVVGFVCGAENMSGGSSGGSSGSGGGRGETPPPASEEIPNESSRFEPDWTSVSITAAIRKQEIDPNGIPVSRQLQVSTIMNVLDVNDLVGISMREVESFAKDDLGNEYHVVDDSPFISHYDELDTIRRINPDCFPPTDEECERWIEELRPVTSYLTFDIDPEQGYPTLLKELSWIMNVLLAKYYSYVEVPFQASDDWYQLTCQLQVRIDQASSVAGQYSYRLTLRAVDEDAGQSSGRSLFEQEIPDTVLSQYQLLGASGKVVSTHNRSMILRMPTSGTSAGAGVCSSCEQVTRIRFVLARGLYEGQVTMSLTDVPVPTF